MTFAGAARLFALATIVGFALPPAGATAAPRDDFAAICLARGGKASACACQAKLARADLSPAERRAAISGMRGGQEAMKKEIAAMGPQRAKAFAGKMQQLSRRAASECR